MLPLIRILLLWITLLFAFHSVFEHFSLGHVAAKTLAAGIEPNALKFYGFLAAFAIGAHYFCREIEEWKRPMPVKVGVSAVLAIAFLWSLLGLANLDTRQYEEIENYQKELVAGRLGTRPSALPHLFKSAVATGASLEEVGKAFPNSLPTTLEVRRDGTAYQNFFYWMGPGILPIGAQVSYSTMPHRVNAVEALPRALPSKPQPRVDGDTKADSEEGFSSIEGGEESKSDERP